MPGALDASSSKMSADHINCHRTRLLLFIIAPDIVDFLPVYLAHCSICAGIVCALLYQHTGIRDHACTWCRRAMIGYVYLVPFRARWVEYASEDAGSERG
jgi:hypothetical protein